MRIVELECIRPAWRRELENVEIVSWRLPMASYTGRLSSRCQERPSATRAVERLGIVETYLKLVSMDDVREGTWQGVTYFDVGVVDAGYGEVYGGCSVTYGCGVDPPSL